MTLERRAWIIARGMAVLLVLASLQGVYWQLWRGRALQPVVLDPVDAAREYARLRGEPVVDSQDEQLLGLVDLPQPVIQRTVQMLSGIQRGTIYDRAGTLLAEDQGVPGNYRRIYYEPSLAHVIGYTSALRTGINGLEASYNDSLLGFDRLDTEIDRVMHRPFRGSSLVLTIDNRIQKAAAQALDGRPGAVIVLDGHSGAVLAMTSTPSYDPNLISTPGYIASLSEGELVNRATQGLFTPGSTYKMVTLITALETGRVEPDTVIDFGEPRKTAEGRIYYVYEVDGGQIIDPNHEQSRLDITQSFVYSANITFAKIGNEMDPDVMIEYAARMGFSEENYTRRFPVELPVSVPQLANDLDSIRTNNLLRAHTAYGQGELLTTPLNMAMIVQAVVNEGTVPIPYLVESIRSPQNEILRATPNGRTTRELMSAETANQVKDMMIAAVQHTYQDGMVGPGILAGGKTGTAQLDGNLEPHSWFVGFAEQGDWNVVIAVLLEHGGAARNAMATWQVIAKAAAEVRQP